MSTRLVTAGLIVLASAAPALADSATFQGDLAGKPIVVQLSADPAAGADQTLVGRYAYGHVGVDIPLHAVSVSGKDLVLYEELPCTDVICEADYMAETFPEAIRGATWTLRLSDDGKALSGTWKAPSGKKSLPIELEWVGTRPYDPPDGPSVETLAEYASDANGPIPPYEALKLAAVKLESVEVVRWGDVAFHYLVDPRTKLRFPEIVDLGGVDPAPANAELAQRHSFLSLNALDCEARDYFSLGWFPGSDVARDTLGGYPNEEIKVTYLSPTLLTFTESGSLFCGGAHPDNHSNSTTLDLATGQSLDFAEIFSGWTKDEYGDHPSDALIDFVSARRSTLAYPDFDAECAIPDLIPQYLGVRFDRGDRVTFTLEGLPHAIVACGDDLLTMPLAELRPFLAPTAADYFPALKQ